jgi:hypothetical protein
MIAFVRVSLVVGVAVVTACASGKSTPASSSGPARWNGSFRQPQNAASSVIGPATPGRAAAFGTLNLTPVEGRPGAYQVELSMNAPVQPSTQLAWAIFSGPCGTPSPAVAGLNEFPVIEISTAGGGVHGVMKLALDSRSAYHANVYWNSRASDVSNVMMCANLAFNGPG